MKVNGELDVAYLLLGELSLKDQSKPLYICSNIIDLHIIWACKWLNENLYIEIVLQVLL